MKQQIRIVGALALMLAVTAGCSRGQQWSPATAPPPSQTPTATRSLPPSERLTALATPRAVLAALDALSSQFAASSAAAYDVSAKATELGPSVDAAFAFVRDQVRFEVYRGVLRGARGTLMGLAGNAYDRSLLLAALLTHHGIRVRFVQGRLSPERAKWLVAHMFGTVSSRVAGGPAPTGTPPNAGAAAEELAALVMHQVETHFEIVKTALEARRIVVASAPDVDLDMLEQEATDHLWVEYDRAGQWVALDSSFTGAQPGQVFTAPLESFDDVPQSAFHRVTIRVIREERQGSQLVMSVPLIHTAAAATLNGADVTFRYNLEPVSGGWTATPVLQVDGRTIEGTATASSGLGGVGTVPGQRARDILGGRPSAVAGELVAEWLEFEFSSPNGTVDRVRREIVDRVAPADRANRGEAVLQPLEEYKTVPLYLQSTYGLSVTSGPLHPDLLTARLLDHKETLKKIHLLMVDSSGTPRTLSDAEKRELAQLADPIQAAVLSHRAMSLHVASQRGLPSLRQWFPSGTLWFYEAAPRLAISSLTLAMRSGDAPAGVLALDLRWNPLRVVGAEVPRGQLAVAAMLQGIVDGIWEQLALSPSPQATQPGIAASAVGVMDAARSAGATFEVVTNQEEVQRVAASADDRARILESLRGRAIAVVPSKPLPGPPGGRLAWWTVDTASGQALAVLDNGLHGAAVEYAVTLSIMDIAGALTLTAVMIGSLAYFAYFIFMAGWEQGRLRGQYESNERRRGNCAWTTGPCNQTCGPGFPQCSGPVPPPPPCGPYLPGGGSC